MTRHWGEPTGWDIVGSHMPASFSLPDFILEQIADMYGVTVRDIKGRRRDKAISPARQHAMHNLQDIAEMSLPEIGRLLGGRDHTTVLDGIKNHLARVEAQDWENRLSDRITVLTDLRNRATIAGVG